MINYSQKIVRDSKEKLELVFGCNLSDEEICQILHEMTTVVRIVYKGEMK